tara:strand:+ start:9990 stop:11150 length:1161 start_codon:yes stop_codon:yes gene_type:complete
MMQAENEVVQDHKEYKPHLTHKETRQIVTPYAFHVSADLFGTALARPLKRGIAIGIDVFLITLLSQSASFLLAGVAAVTFFRAGKRLKLKKRFNAARLALRFVAATLLFVFALGIFDSFNSNKPNGFQPPEEVSLSGANALVVVAVTAKYILAANELVEKVDNGECANNYLCWQSLGNELVDVLNEAELPSNEAMDLLEGIVDIANQQLSTEEKSALLADWQTQLEMQNKNRNETEKASSAITDSQNPVEQNEGIDSVDKQNEDKGKATVISWLEDIMEDLGIGFGWAAFYFSIFTAWWKGQTPGKKLLGIKVIKLDGKEPNLWESFGRYGGYGAGFATGLLGFLQVYWDPNRQAIQDKISETLVIDLRVAKVDFVAESQPSAVVE